jgi:hypothetical protein
MAKIYNSKILDFSSEPFKKPEGQFWYDATNKVLKRSDGTAFSPINVENNYIDNNATTLSKKLESIDTSLSNVVHKTGDEQISGNKTFSDSISLSVSNTDNTFNSTCTLLHDSISIQHSDDSSNSSIFIGSNGISVNDVTNITSFGFSTMPLAAGEDILLLSTGGTVIDNSILLPYGKPVFIGSKVETISADGNIDPSTGEGYNLHFGIGYEYDPTNNEALVETPVIKGSLVDSSISSSSLDTHIPTSKAVYDAISSKQDSLSTYSETADGSEVALNTSNFNLESVNANITSSNAIDLLSGTEGDATYSKVYISDPDVYIHSSDGAITLYNYYSNEYDSAKVSLEEGQITLSSRENILFNLSQHATTVPVELSMHLEGDLLDTPKVELTGIDRLNVAETLKVNNKPVALAEDLNNKQDKLSYYTEDDSGSVSISAGHTLSLGSIEGFSLSDTYNNRISASGPSGILFTTGIGNTSKYVKLSYDGDNKFINAEGIDNLSINNSIKINNEDVLTTSALNGYIKENTNALVSGIHSNSSSPLQIYAAATYGSGEGNNINITGGYYGVITLAGDGDLEKDHPRLIVDPSTGISLLHKDVIIDTTETITGNPNTDADVRITTNELVLNAPKVSGTLIATEVSESHTEKPDMLITAQAVYWGLDYLRVNIENNYIPNSGKYYTMDKEFAISGEFYNDGIEYGEFYFNRSKIGYFDRGWHDGERGSWLVTPSGFKVNGDLFRDLITTSRNDLDALLSEDTAVPSAKLVSNLIADAKLTAGTGINISEDNVISVEYPEFVASITDEYTASTSLNSFLTNNNYGVTSGKIIITPNINNVGPIYFGEGLTSAAKGFPVYPDQIITLSFNNLENFKCYAASSGDKFNYIAYIGEVDNAGTASGNINANEVKLTSPNGIQYSISITDEGIIQVDPA